MKDEEMLERGEIGLTPSNPATTRIDLKSLTAFVTQ